MLEWGKESFWWSLIKIFAWNDWINIKATQLVLERDVHIKLSLEL